MGEKRIRFGKLRVGFGWCRRPETTLFSLMRSFYSKAEKEFVCFPWFESRIL